MLFLLESRGGTEYIQVDFEGGGWIAVNLTGAIEIGFESGAQLVFLDPNLINVEREGEIQVGTVKMGVNFIEVSCLRLERGKTKENVKSPWIMAVIPLHLLPDVSNEAVVWHDLIGANAFCMMSTALYEEVMPFASEEEDIVRFEEKDNESQPESERKKHPQPWYLPGCGGDV
ncbi:hypothetical protein KKC60_02625 [Patescibacteria group bacterium]|nr:hypothetical protein [Patescibacteria group bacterium]